MSEDSKRLQGLASMPLPELRSEWRRFHTSDPPTAMSKELLRLAIAYKVQEEMFGGLSRRTLLRLKALSADKLRPKGARSGVRTATRFKPGTKLIREWKGKVHEVLVLDDGQYAYIGKSYRSLTEIAFQITGAHWSGPRFFGLTSTGRNAEARDQANG